MKIKVSEATGPVLDWLAAKCEGYEPEWDENDFWLEHPTLTPCWLTNTYEPSTDWAQGGPIIEREKISFREERTGVYFGYIWNGVNHVGLAEGPTPLIAAMRAYVASKLGDEVDVPSELIS